MANVSLVILAIFIMVCGGTNITSQPIGPLHYCEKYYGRFSATSNMIHWTEMKIGSTDYYNKYETKTLTEAAAVRTVKTVLVSLLQILGYYIYILCI